MELTQRLRRKPQAYGNGFEDSELGTVASQEEGTERWLKDVIYAGWRLEIAVERVALGSNIVGLLEFVNRITR
jgi:hypothetical protein